MDRKQRKLDELIKELKDKEFKYIPREEREIDWSSYDEAQLNEVNDMLLMIRDTVDEAALRLGIKGAKFDGPGRPPYPPEDLAKAILMQQYFCVANRMAAGLVLLFREKMGIKQAFSYKTIERAYDDPFVTLILNEVFKMTQEPVKELEKNFSADGTGLSTSMKQNWERDRDDEKKRAGYEKMVAMVGTTYGLISAVELPDNPAAHESPLFAPLLEETACSYSSIELVSLDEAYLSRNNCDLIEKVGAIPRIHPKKRNHSEAEGQLGVGRDVARFHGGSTAVVARVPPALDFRNSVFDLQAQFSGAAAKAHPPTEEERGVQQGMRLQHEKAVLPMVSQGDCRAMEE